MTQEKPTRREAVSKAVLVSAPEGIIVIDAHGLVLLANAQTEELFGYDPDEMIGLHFEALLPEVFREPHQQQTAGPTSDPGSRPARVELEVPGVRKDGSALLLEMSVSSVESQDGPLVCCILRKIDESFQSEKARREMEEQFRLMVENSHDILTIRDADAKIRYMSPSINRVLGYTQEQMVGATGFELIHPEDRPTVETALQEFWKNPGARDSIQYRARHANGTWISLEVVAYNLLEHPVIRGVVINGRDISERKHEEAGREQLITDLQEAISKVNSLTGLLPICASCKKIHDENGKWQQIETYIRERSKVEFSHGMCPECARLWYPDHCE
jgi:PAS domain S-box-containing protein